MTFATVPTSQARLIARGFGLPSNHNGHPWGYDALLDWAVSSYWTNRAGTRPPITDVKGTAA